MQRPTWEERKAKQNPKWVSNTVLVVLKISLKIQSSLHNHLCRWDHCYYFEGEKSVEELFPWGLGLTWYSLKRQWGRITDSWAEMHFSVCVCVYKTRVSKGDAHDQSSSAQFKLQQQWELCKASIRGSAVTKQCQTVQSLTKRSIKDWNVVSMFMFMTVRL